MTSAMNSEQIRELIKDWAVPPGFLRLIRGRVVKRAIRLTAHESAILSRNSKFHNVYAGRRCFIIGNGPSLNKQDLTPLANEITITMNQFNEHPILGKWKPTFFCMADPLYIEKPEILPGYLANIEAQAYFFLLEAKDSFDENKLLDPDRVYYLKMTGKLLHNWPMEKYGLDLTRTVLAARNTAQMAIMIALYAGCSPIYLLGLDHDWLAHPAQQRHFYESGRQAVESSMSSYNKLVEWVLNIWRVYESLQHVASNQGVTIYNATEGGFLDVFPRVEFKTLFGH